MIVLCCAKHMGVIHKRSLQCNIDVTFMKLLLYLLSIALKPDINVLYGIKCKRHLHQPNILMFFFNDFSFCQF